MSEYLWQNSIGRVIALAIGCGLVGGCQPRDEFTDVRSQRVPAPALETPPFAYQGDLGAIYSGDAIEVFVGNQSHLVRLVGIDCPEPGAEKFQSGRHFVRKMVGGNSVRVDVHWRDETNMEIGQVWVGDRDLGLELIRAGLAQLVDEDFSDREKYRQASQSTESSNQ